MKPEYKIAIIGMGGVGGYIGVKLASFYKNSSVEINFIARGSNKDAIQKDGLKLITSQGVEIGNPYKISSNPDEIGPVNLVICCVKDYDLQNAIFQVMPCINTETVILPLQNGLNASEQIRQYLPKAKVLTGCIYIVSRLIKPGIVEQIPGINQLLFGDDTKKQDIDLKHIETLLKKAGLTADISENITLAIWEKFYFISILATITSYSGMTIGMILESPDQRELLIGLMDEISAIAATKGIHLPSDMKQKSLETFDSMDFNVTSSMHTDFQKGNKTELESLTGIVVALGKELSVPTPLYEKMYQFLQTRNFK